MLAAGTVRKEEANKWVSKEHSNNACDHHLTKKSRFRKTVLYVENLDEQNVGTS